WRGRLAAGLARRHVMLRRAWRLLGMRGALHVGRPSGNGHVARACTPAADHCRSAFEEPVGLSAGAGALALRRSPVTRPAVLLSVRHPAPLLRAWRATAPGRALRRPVSVLLRRVGPGAAALGGLGCPAAALHVARHLVLLARVLLVASRAPRRVTAGPLRVPGQRRVLRLSRRLPQLTALEPAELGVGMSAAQL